MRNKGAKPTLSTDQLKEILERRSKLKHVKRDQVVHDLPGNALAKIVEEAMEKRRSHISGYKRGDTPEADSDSEFE
ncbi:hypothetical protein [Candidatus Paracaedibacter symbiosus]|uniref:hypothetical protein n=1 Tax=Candidatus Paracaedibacter symbiosus TaxID=244582 RepID=UPI000509ED09|nr:hypothetical protein [Candidatus Paracaedibacter symbiosus]